MDWSSHSWSGAWTAGRARPSLVRTYPSLARLRVFELQSGLQILFSPSECLVGRSTCKFNAGDERVMVLKIFGNQTLKHLERNRGYEGSESPRVRWRPRCVSQAATIAACSECQASSYSTGGT